MVIALCRFFACVCGESGARTRAGAQPDVQRTRRRRRLSCLLSSFPLSSSFCACCVPFVSLFLALRLQSPIEHLVKKHDTQGKALAREPATTRQQTGGWRPHHHRQKLLQRLFKNRNSALATPGFCLAKKRGYAVHDSLRAHAAANRNWCCSSQASATMRTRAESVACRERMTDKHGFTSS